MKVRADIHHGKSPSQATRNQRASAELLTQVQQMPELEKSETQPNGLAEYYRVVIDRLPTGIYIAQNREFKFVNSSFCTLLGYSKDELLGMDPLSLVHPEYMHKVKEDAVKMLKGKRSSQYEYQIVRKGGEVRWVQEAVISFQYEGHRATWGHVRDITEQKQLEEELRESEEKLRLIFESAADGIIVVDLEATVIEANEAFLRTYGYNHKEEIIGQNGLQFIAEKDRAIAIEDMMRAIEMGYGTRSEYTIVGKDGAEYDIEASAALMRSRSGNPVGFISIVRDITDRKRTEEELIRLSNAVKMSTDSIVIGDLEVNIVEVNEATLKMYGTDDKRDLIGQNAFYIVAPEDREKALASLEEVRERGFSESREYHIVTKDGGRVLVEMSTAIMKGVDGKPTGLVAVSRDITERKRTEEALRDSERRYRFLAENVTDVIFTTDLELNFTYVSPSVTGLTGYTVQEVIARRVEQILTPASFEVASNTLLEELAIENMEQKDLLRSRTLELEINRKDGSTFTAEVRMSFLRQPSGRAVAVLGVARDITERKRAEEALTKKKEELEQKTNQLQAVNKELEAFTYSVSHDLRAPLRSIDGFSQVLLEDYIDRLDDEGKSYLMRVRSASQRMAELIDDLLNLSRVTRGEMRYETVDLSALAQTVSMDIQQSQPERDVEFTIAPGLVTKGDAHLLRVVLENLLGNAWKFTNKRERARIEFGYAKTDGQPAYFVRDNGVGFDMAYADRLFGAFQRLHSQKEFEGTGIGLATVQRIIHRHGGSTWAEGAVEQGATFYFTL